MASECFFFKRKNIYSERLQNVARLWKNGQNGRHGAGQPFLPFRATFWSRSEYLLPSLLDDPRSLFFRPELKGGGVSLVRELHVYGSVVPVSARDPGKFQHRGFGTLLMEEAERIARDEHGATKLAVISGERLSGRRSEDTPFLFQEGGLTNPRPGDNLS